MFLRYFVYIFTTVRTLVFTRKGITQSNDLSEVNDTPKFSESDAWILENADYMSAGEILDRLEKNYNAHGKEALTSAIPALNKRVKKELQAPEELRWNLFCALRLLSLTGDECTRPVFLNSISKIW